MTRFRRCPFNSVLVGLAFIYALLVLCKCERNKLVVVVVDGLAKWMLDDYRLTARDLAGFGSMRLNGAVAEYMYPEFPTLSLPNLQTAVTGLHVENHGLCADYIYDVESDTHFHRFAKNADIDEFWLNDQTETFWTTAQRQGVRASVHWWPGCQIDFPSCDANVGQIDAKDLNAKFVQVVDKLSLDELDVAMINYNKIDIVASRKGAQSSETIDEIRLLSDALQQLQRMLDTRNLSPTTNLIVMSERGRADVPTETNWYFVDDFVDMDSVETVVNSGAFMLVYPRKGHEHQVYKDLSAAPPQVKVFWKDDLNVRWRLKGAKRLSPIVLVCDVPYAIYCRTREKLVPAAKSQASIEDVLPKSVGGFDNVEEKMWSMFLAKGPDFHRNASVPMLRLVDVYQIVCHVTGIRCQANNGSWASAAPLLLNPGSSEDQRRSISFDSLSGAGAIVCTKQLRIVGFLIETIFVVASKYFVAYV